MKPDEMGRWLGLITGLVFMPGLIACGGGDDTGCGGHEELTASATIGTNGGSVELCEAKITVPEGAYASDVEVTITRRQVEGVLPFEFERVSDAYRVEAGHDNAGAVVLQVNHTSGKDSRLAPAFLQDASAWIMMEPCGVDTGTVEFHLDGSFDLTFTVLHDTVEFPGEAGGAGSLVTAVEGEGLTRSFSLEEGFATFAPDRDGIRGINLMGFQNTGGDLLGKLQLSFVLDADSLVPGTTVADMSLLLGEHYESWMAAPGLTTAQVAVELTSVDGDHLTGTFQGQLENIDETISIHSGSFDAQVEKWRWPTEMFCMIER